MLVASSQNLRGQGINRTLIVEMLSGFCACQSCLRTSYALGSMPTPDRRADREKGERILIWVTSHDIFFSFGSTNADRICRRMEALHPTEISLQLLSSSCLVLSVGSLYDPPSLRLLNHPSTLAATSIDRRSRSISAASTAVFRGHERKARGGTSRARFASAGGLGWFAGGV